MKAAYIEWLDPAYRSGAQSVREAQALTPHLMQSVGILVNSDGEVVRLAQDYSIYTEEDGSQPETYRHISVILRVLIQKMVVWETDAVDIEAPAGEGIPTYSWNTAGSV